MDRIKVMVNGIPGNMATTVARHILDDEQFELISEALTGPEIQKTEFSIGETVVHLIRPETRERAIDDIKNAYGDFLTVDFSHPAAVNDNAAFYCKHALPFVMGTTGGDRKLLEQSVLSSSIPAVIAPNMAKQIVGFQAMMEYAANTFPNLFGGYSLEIRESHQKGKADTSGTAKAMVGYFNKLGVDFAEDEILMERDPQIQKTQWGIPEEYLAGHGWHTYSLVSDDKTVRFEFTHNVNGREIYAKGTLNALTFLNEKVRHAKKGKVYTMIDVLKGI
jgi:4-hydroxy-tetrahydrodipicolinate reductase